MFRHILVPLDFSEKNRSALDAARDLAQHHGARVTLLHVIETIHHVPEGELKHFYGNLEKRSREMLLQSQTALEDERVEVIATVVFGNRADEIVRYAVDQCIDLIVMSSARLDPSQPGQPWPTISHKVALVSPRPVLLVR